MACCVLTAITSCSDDNGGDGGDGRLDVDALRAATECPVDLAGGLLDLDLSATGPTDVVAGAPEAGSITAIAEGAVVECRLGDVRVLVALSDVEAGPTAPSALSLMIPLVAQELGVSADELDEALDELGADPPVGEVIDFGVEGPLVAVPVSPGDADTALVVVTSETVAHDDLTELADRFADELD